MWENKVSLQVGENWMFYVSPEKQNHKQGFSKVMRDSAKTFLQKKKSPSPFPVSAMEIWDKGPHDYSTS